MSDETLSEDLEIQDPDLYVASFFVPAAHRSDVLALMRFAVELERVSVQVKEPMIAQIRYAWWREQVAALWEGRAVASPVVQGLGPVVGAHQLPRAPFDAMIDAHGLDCEATPFSGMAQFEAYCRDTSGSLMRLMARVLGAGERADAACDAAGLAAGAALQLRSFDHWRRHRRLRLPLSPLLEGGVNEDDVFGGGGAEALGAAFGVIRLRIRAALGEVNRTRFPRAAMPALALATLARPVMTPGRDPLVTGLVSPLGRVARLAAANLLWRV
jgi:phytoene synthase